jgi:ubiquinone/menaquinone biosynthesis C-methylase UbiE
MVTGQSRETDKERVYSYWNANPCESDEYFIQVGGTKRLGKYRRFSREYFDVMECARYAGQRDIMAFAQFPLYHGKRVLEIGVGSGNDFIQWVRSGAEAYGIDLTPAAVEITQAHLKAYGLKCASLRIADAEELPFNDDFFDVVYSWGVLHHTPHTDRAIAEAVRVAKPGGTIKLMLYNRRSLVAIKHWLRYALLKGRPFRTLSDVIYHDMESIGTKAYTQREVLRMLEHLPVENVHIDAAASTREFGGPPDSSLRRKALFIVRYWLTVFLGLNTSDFFMKIQFNKRVDA